MKVYQKRKRLTAQEPGEGTRPFCVLVIVFAKPSAKTPRWPPFYQPGNVSKVPPLPTCGVHKGFCSDNLKPKKCEILLPGLGLNGDLIVPSPLKFDCAYSGRGQNSTALFSHLSPTPPPTQSTATGHALWPKRGLSPRVTSCTPD